MVGVDECGVLVWREFVDSAWQDDRWLVARPSAPTIGKSVLTVTITAVVVFGVVRDVGIDRGRQPDLGDVDRVVAGVT